MTYRKRKGIQYDTWHWCTNCPNWPTKSESVERDNKPTSGELCNECQRLDAAGECNK